MDFIVVLLFIALFVGFIYLIYRRVSDGKMVITEDMFRQRGVTVDYKAGTITINKHSYSVNKVTGIKIVTRTHGRSDTNTLQIDMDDMVKPVHNIAVVGSRQRADEFSQRLCVAIRKAGGPSFT